MLNEKATIIFLSTGMIKNTWCKWWNWPKSKRLRGNVKVELGLSNYATKSPKHQVLIYPNWCGKLKIRNWWINKIETTQVNSSKPRDVIKTEVIKNILYDEVRLRLKRLKLEKIKSVDTNLEQTTSN